ncbi:serine/threonine-protein kinase [Streptomyces lutosisoli]|uniref:non-specific serine/threonine protein kinase n=1 Tax=Streptomyces lutosisoli TaxID=2665721 RepID=A0ABW2VRU3_9ACTN
MGDLRILASRYRLDRCLGRGGMGEVYEGRDTILDRSVAVKLLSGYAPESPVAAERFLQEARAAARISSRNAVAVYDVGVEDGQPYLVMECLDGVPLSRILAATPGPLPEETVRAVATGMCEGLAAAHGVGIVHRDVKPGNVFLCRDGRVVLMDFGIARLVESAVQTQTGILVGTPVYMAPEAVRGQRVGPAADLYGLGCVMYRMLSGDEPYVSDGSTLGILFAKVNQPPPTLRGRPGLPAALVSTVDDLLEREPHLRPVNAADLAAFIGAPDRAEDILIEVVARHLRQSAAQWARSTPEPGASATPPTSYRIPKPQPAPGSASPWTGQIPPPPGYPPGSSAAGPDFAAPSVEATLQRDTRQLIRQGMSTDGMEGKHREAVLMVSRGKYSDALELHGYLIQVRTAELGAGHPLTLVSQFWAAVCLARLGAAPEALNRLSMISDACSRYGEETLSVAWPAPPRSFGA